MFWVHLVRVVLIVVCCASLLIMANDFRVHRSRWNEKTKDYWYGRVMWTITGIAAGVEGLIRHTSFRFTLILLLAAALATLKGNLQRGDWGTSNDERK